MDVKDAIAWQQALKKIFKNKIQDITPACNMAILALERQMKVKPYVIKYYYFCPNCRTRRSIKQKHKFCHDCGQAFNWGNKNDG